jgi:hypothetical protein
MKMLRAVMFFGILAVILKGEQNTSNLRGTHSQTLDSNFTNNGYARINGNGTTTILPNNITRIIQQNSSFVKRTDMPANASMRSNVQAEISLPANASKTPFITSTATRKPTITPSNTISTISKFQRQAIVTPKQSPHTTSNKVSTFLRESKKTLLY